ncbi:hypothetical protein HT136_04610 [Novosphingobium profundi]|uniref:hypothetical protein n=1 Tax=Novosphingobium profundi TaxID=1774954 RepID=UPI001BDA2DB5|nr:hypothetical protein [Novosphingobium profundi]MBT0667644.1 hypothetical protein [Novosphingobium profundi]
MSGLGAILRSSCGEFETTRVLGTAGAALYSLAAHALLVFDTLGRGHAFDLATYCAAYPGGLVMLIGTAGGVAALKDRQVARSRAIDRENAA